MGKPSKPTPFPREGDDSHSLHTQPGDRFLDDDAPELQVDDLPPLYDEGTSSAEPLLGVPVSQPGLTPTFPGMVPLYRRAENGWETYLDRRLDNDPKVLEKHVNFWAQTPPRPFVRLHGTHTQVVDDNGKKERRTVTDFDDQVELTPYLFSDATNRLSLRELRTVDNGEEVYRGTVFRRRAPGSRQSIEVGNYDKPTLAEWCHRYCASHAGLKSFTLTRRMVGFDEERVQQRLDALVRATNYRGHLSITFPVRDEAVTVFNDCKTNVWRTTTWIWWVCVLTLMFIFTWPYLFFRTKKFEVVYADWAFSVAGENGQRRFVSISEDQWYNMWGRAIHRAVLEKRQCTLDQQDLINAEGAPPVFNNAVVDGAVGFLRAGVSAMNEVNRQLGWGYDS